MCVESAADVHRTKRHSVRLTARCHLCCSKLTSSMRVRTAPKQGIVNGVSRQLADINSLAMGSPGLRQEGCVGELQRLVCRVEDLTGDGDPRSDRAVQASSALGDRKHATRRAVDKDVHVWKPVPVSVGWPGDEGDIGLYDVRVSKPSRV